MNHNKPHFTAHKVGQTPAKPDQPAPIQTKPQSVVLRFARENTLAIIFFLMVAISAPFAFAGIEQWSAHYSLGSAETEMREAHSSAELFREMEAEEVKIAKEAHDESLDLISKRFASKIAPSQEKWQRAKMKCESAAARLGDQCDPKRDFFRERPAPKSGTLTTGYIRFTNYNAEVGQTDDSPCIGASGDDQCGLVQNHGARIIALSRDMVSHDGDKQFKYHDRVVLEQHESEQYNPACNGKYEILDTMNERFTNRGDIFVLDRTKNFGSCQARIIFS